MKNASSGSVGKAATEEMKFLCSLAPEGVLVKGSGGISTFEHALSLIQVGRHWWGLRIPSQLSRARAVEIATKSI